MYFAFSKLVFAAIVILLQVCCFLFHNSPPDSYRLVFLHIRMPVFINLASYFRVCFCICFKNLLPWVLNDIIFLFIYGVLQSSKTTHWMRSKNNIRSFSSHLCAFEVMRIFLGMAQWEMFVTGICYRKDSMRNIHFP